jgi:hypothetical protein
LKALRKSILLMPHQGFFSFRIISLRIARGPY